MPPWLTRILPLCLCFVPQPKDLYRVNLLNAWPWLRRFLRSDIWPEQINFK